LSRIKGQALNKKSLEALIQCGALDSLGERGQMLAHIERCLEFHRESVKEHAQDSLFSGSGPAELVLPPAEPASQEARLGWEKELLGLYVSGHPLDKFKDKLAARPMNLAQIKRDVVPGQLIVVAGMIADIRTILTKGGDQMAFVKLADYDDTLEAVVFPKGFAQYKDILKPDSCIALKGRLSNRNGELSMVADALKTL
jgi:DNA polymerase-3 subunit alpha